MIRWGLILRVGVNKYVRRNRRSGEEPGQKACNERRALLNLKGSNHGTERHYLEDCHPSPVIPTGLFSSFVLASLGVFA
jgi:hypothetical protein